MSNVVPLNLSADAALRMVRQLAADTERIVVINHGKMRMRQRKVSRRQIELCLQRGTVTEGPYVNQKGDWQMNIYRHAAGEELTCVVAIEWASRLLVVTTF